MADLCFSLYTFIFFLPHFSITNWWEIKSVHMHPLLSIPHMHRNENLKDSQLNRWGGRTWGARCDRHYSRSRHPSEGTLLSPGQTVAHRSWYAHNQPSCQRQVMVFVHGVQSLHGRREKASFVLDVNSGWNSQFRQSHTKSYIYRKRWGMSWQLHCAGL